MNEANGMPPVSERVEALVPRIEQAADDIDARRELPPALAEQMKQAGLFRLLVPQSLGGEELDWPIYLDAVLKVARADGSTGWCFNQGAVFATTSCRAPQVLAQEVWGDPLTVVSNGPPQRAEWEAVDGGFRLSGRWMFSSGCRHANWVAALTGRPTRLYLIPKDEVEFVDAWQVHGLRGTGSFSFEAKDLFVPEHRTMLLEVEPLVPGPLYVIPQALLFACGFGCVALGVARAALDATENFARGKRPRFGSRPISEDGVVQRQVGQAEAGYRAAKALLFETVGEVWDAVCGNGAITLEERIRLRMAGTHAMRESARVVDILYNLSGSDSIFEQTAIQRRFQDAHVITQQIQGREAHYETVGQYFLGLDPDGLI